MAADPTSPPHPTRHDNAALAGLIEGGRSDDAAHARRVGDLAALLAGGVGLPSGEVERIRRAAPFHDIGIVGVPDAILRKPGHLTEVEFDLVKRHVDIGVTMLSHGVSGDFAMARLIVQTHHERFDGSGYPHGLAGDAVALPGQIVAIADVFDTLTRRRPYRRAWSVDEAAAEIRRRAGTKYSPDLVDLFLHVIAEHDTHLRGGAPSGPSLQGRVDLDTLLELLVSFGNSGRTGCLTIEVGLAEATLFLDGGRIVHAEFEGADGEDAVGALLARAGGYHQLEFVLAPFHPSGLGAPRPTIAKSLPQLLIGATVEIDHRAEHADRQPAPAPDVAGHLRPGPFRPR